MRLKCEIIFLQHNNIFIHLNHLKIMFFLHSLIALVCFYSSSFWQPTQAQNCPSPALVCQNGGIFNEKSCACNCFPSYNGTTCELIMCDTQDPPACGTFHKSYCTISVIQNYCPKLCGRACNTVACLNGAKLKNSQCECLPQFEGKQCENIKCLNEDARCYVNL